MKTFFNKTSQKAGTIRKTFSRRAILTGRKGTEEQQVLAYLDKGGFVPMGREMIARLKASGLYGIPKE